MSGELPPQVLEHAHPPGGPSASIFFKEFLAGSSAGLVCKLLDQPFDTVKVTQQLKGHSIPGAIRDVYGATGFFGFYKGLFYPMFGAVFENAISFSTFSLGKHLLVAYDPSLSNTTLQTVVAGAFSGLGCGLLLSPIELIKCTMQDQASQKVQKYRNSLHCSIEMVRSGGVRVLARGLRPSMFREGVGNCAFFTTYETLCRLMTPEGGTKDDLGPKVALAGAFSGTAFWTASMPFDTVKSLVQTREEYRYKSIPTVLRMVYQAKGFRGLYSGWGITVIRAFPTNAALFYTYEFVAKSLGLY